MCGILGIVAPQPIDRDLVMKMRDTMVHRGPDDAGNYISPNGTVALGHRRLSIIDLSEQGRQPMCNEDGTIWLSFNGEIYNFQELRAMLQVKGHSFKSKTDSEVVIHAYEEWGEHCVRQLWGMFAFVIWDERKALLFGARDRLGVKPLHYFHRGDTFICASEIKAIVENPLVPRHLDRSALCDFLTYRYIPSPKTIWKHVRKLPPGHAFTYRRGNLQIWRYWTLETGEKQISESDAVEQLEELFTDAVRRRLVSDVPIGLFLSGGLDSASVAWAMHEQAADIHSLTIGFKNSEHDETVSAEAVAKCFRTLHEVEYFSERELSQLDEMMWYFDEPFGASSMLPTYMLSRVARKSVTVALSGDGGDEAFAGYNWYDTLLKSSTNKKVSGSGGKDDLAKRYRQVTTPRFTRSELDRLFVEPLDDVEPDELWFFRQAINPSLSGVKQLQWLDAHTFLPEEVLTKVDRASMANSLEVRSPFRDHRIYEWVFLLSDNVYFSGQKKRLIKGMLANRVPEPIIQKEKKGFSAPVRQYWNDERVNCILEESLAANDGLFRRDVICSMIKSQNCNSTYAKRWLLFILELWYRRWMPQG